jgi:hypothetical protein
MKTDYSNRQKIFTHQNTHEKEISYKTYEKNNSFSIRIL